MKETEHNNNFDIDAVSAAAHIFLTEDEKAKMTADVQKVIDFAGTLEGQCGDGGTCFEERYAPLRADEPESRFAREDMLDSSSSDKGGKPYVMRVVEGE